MAVLSAATAAYGWLIAYIINVANDMREGGAISPDAADNAKAFARTVVPVIVGVTLVSGIAMFAQAVLANSVALRVIADLQKHMFGAMHRADFAHFQRQPVGTLISRFTNDVNVLSQALLRTMSNLVREVLTIVFCVAMMFYLDWFMSVLVLCVYPIAFIPIIAISKRLRGNAADAQAQIGTITAQLSESFSGARLVRSYALEDHEDKRLGKSFDERVRLTLKLVTNQARVDPILEVLGGIAIAGVFAFGVYRVIGGTTSAGDIAGVLTMVIAIAPRARALGTLNNVVQEGLAALRRIFDLIDTKPSILQMKNAHDLTAPKGDIRFTDVGFAYEDGTQAVEGLSFHILPGQTTALVGPSGGGKSTVLNLIGRLYEAGSGSIEIDNQNIRGLTLESLRAAMALVSQDTVLFDDSIAANIRFGRLDASQDDVAGAAKAANAHDFIMAMDGGYDAPAGEDGGKLSGGQRQRIALARAILKNAPILLLDEATSALDARAEAEVQSALARLTKDRTVLVIAHRLATVKSADNILVLDKGRIVESGNHKALIAQNGLYARLRELQFR